MKCPKCGFDNQTKSPFCLHCFANLPSNDQAAQMSTDVIIRPKAKLNVGQIFAGRYLVLEELGRGGMGKIYKVLDQEIGQKVALKIIAPELAADETALEQFRAELKHARQVSHRHVCRMYDLGKAEGVLYITMEYVAGEDLRNLLRKINRFTGAKVLQILRQVAEGLAEVHRLGIVHCDLKPQNILIDGEGNVRILDFGIARTLKPAGGEESDIVLGTPEYLSPEQITGKEADPRADLYSLGIILYEMLVGRPPFQGKNYREIFEKHRSQPVPDPRLENPDIPEKFVELLSSLLQKNREKRMASASDLLKAIRQIEETIPVTERLLAEKSVYAITKSFLKRPALRWLLLVTALLALGGGGLLLRQRLLTRHTAPITPIKPALAVLYFKNNTGRQNLDYWRSALADLLTADLAQSKFMRVLSSDRVLQLLREQNLVQASTYSAADIGRLARSETLHYIIFGAYSLAGNTYRIDVTIKEATSNEAIGMETVQGQGEESVFPMVDELTGKLKPLFNLSRQQISADINKQIGQITTSSPLALKCYQEGKELYQQSKYQESITVLNKAVAVDPQFALAYWNLAEDYGYLNNKEEEKKALQKALSLQQRISERERFLIQAYAANVFEKNPTKAIAKYLQLLSIYPEDETALIYLASMYRIQEDWENSKKYFSRVLELNNHSETAINNLVFIAMSRGKYDQAIKILQKNSTNIKNSANLHSWLSQVYLCQGNLEASNKEIAEALSLEPNNMDYQIQQGNIEQISDNIKAAEKAYSKLLEQKDPLYVGEAHFWLGVLFCQEGKFARSKAELKNGIKIMQQAGLKESELELMLWLIYIYLQKPDLHQAGIYIQKIFTREEELAECSLFDKALHLSGIYYCMNGNSNEAEKSANRLKQISENNGVHRAYRYYFSLNGVIEQHNGKLGEAIRNFANVFSIIASQKSQDDEHAIFMAEMAAACFQNRDFKEAQKYYETIVKLTTGRLYFGDIYARSHYWLGRTFQEMKQDTRSREYYEKFLNIWKEADASLPEPADARRRLDLIEKNKTN